MTVYYIFWGTKSAVLEFTIQNNCVTMVL